MRLYIIRHADPDYPNNTITAAGHLEAQALAKHLTSYNLTHLYSSPLGRTLHTAQYSVDLLKLPLQMEEWMRELSGWQIEQASWGTFAAWDYPGELIRANEPYPARENWHRTPPFDNPHFQAHFERLKQSSDEFLARHGYAREGGRYRCVKPNRDKIAVFCHGGFGLAWLAHLLELPLPLVWSGFWLAPSSVTTVLFDERSPTWAVPRCIGLGDTSHLHLAGLKVRPRGILANFE